MIIKYPCADCSNTAQGDCSMRCEVWEREWDTLAARTTAAEEVVKAAKALQDAREWRLTAEVPADDRYDDLTKYAPRYDGDMGWYAWRRHCKRRLNEALARYEERTP